MKRILSLLLLITLTACPKADESTREMNDTKAKLKRITKQIKASGDVQTAALLESKIILLDERDASSYITLAKSLRSMKKHDEALDILIEGEEFSPENNEIKLEIAKTLIEKDRADAALAKLKEIGEIENKDYYNAKAVALDMKEEYSAAQDTYKKGLMVEPKNGLLLNNLALSYLLDKQYEKGTIILEELVERPNGVDKYRHNLALAYGLQGKDKKAFKILEADISPEQAKENLEYYKNLR